MLAAVSRAEGFGAMDLVRRRKGSNTHGRRQAVMKLQVYRVRCAVVDKTPYEIANGASSGPGRTMHGG